MRSSIYSSGHLTGRGSATPTSPSVVSDAAVKDNGTGNVRLIKTFVLVVLCFQSSGHALLTRYSTSVLKETYSSSEVVVMGEFIKLIFSGVMTVLEMSDNWPTRCYRLKSLVKNSHKVVVLSFLYMIGNMLAYYALARVDAATYTVFLQLKVLTTASFSRLILGKYFTWTQWRALLLLIVGCILVASPSIVNDSEADAEGEARYSNSVMGIGSVLVMVAISGFASVYFEGILKDEREKCTIWERNFQLSFFSILLLLILGMYERHRDSSAYGVIVVPFQGWTINTVLICIIQASGGLLVAATLKYADSVIKTLVTAGSIVLSTIFGYLLLGGTLNIYVLLGCWVTIIAIFNYMFVEVSTPFSLP